MNCTKMEKVGQLLQYSRRRPDSDLDYIDGTSGKGKWLSYLGYVLEVRTKDLLVD